MQYIYIFQNLSVTTDNYILLNKVWLFGDRNTVCAKHKLSY